MQEPKKVQFNIKNSTTREVSIDLFNASSITPITNETQFQAGAVNTLSPFYLPENGFYNPITNETILFNNMQGFAVVNQENSTSSVFYVDSRIFSMAISSSNNIYAGKNDVITDTNPSILVLDSITYSEITEIIIPNINTDVIYVVDISYSPVNNYIYVSTYNYSISTSFLIYIDCATNLIVGSLILN